MEGFQEGFKHLLDNNMDTTQWKVPENRPDHKK